MQTLKSIRFYLLFMLLIGLFLRSTAQQSDLKVLRMNLLNDALTNKGYAPRIERYIQSDYSKTQEYLKLMKKEGSWPDIEYSDRDNDWNPLFHLDRILVMSYNYRNPDSKHYQNKKVLAGIEKALSFWYQTNPECDNWYKNKIAKQFYFNVIALLLEGSIEPTLFSSMLNNLTENPGMTGSNRTLLAISTFYRGVLSNDEEMIRLGVSGVTDQIIVTTDEGVQPDYSFHQHGKFIYNGSYGFNYLRESAWLATIVHGTKFAFSDEQIKVLRDYYLEGTRWMLRGRLLDYNVRGRQVGRQDAMNLGADLLLPVLKRLELSDSDFASEYQKSIQFIENNLPQETLGHKHFWRSDYSIVHRKNYSISLKMCSERTVGIELNMNSENKLGYWLPYGLTYLYKSGREYDAIFPAWNWARLPGVTNPNIEIVETGKGVAHTQQTAFVGGVGNGMYGISAMDFNREKTKAKKSWFWFENEFVALGAGIESEHDSTIITTVNQCLQNGDVEIWTEDSSKVERIYLGKKSVTKPDWVVHDNVGYFFPKQGNLEISANLEHGNLQDIYGLGKDTVFSHQVFSLWLNHGVHPENASYEYIVIPNVQKEELHKYVKKPGVEILLNTKQAQVVYHKELQVCGIVFYEKGEVETSYFSLNAGNPCLVLVDLKNSEISVADPTARLKKLFLQVKLHGNEAVHKEVELPQNGFAGKSVTLKI